MRLWAHSSTDGHSGCSVCDIRSDAALSDHIQDMDKQSQLFLRVKIHHKRPLPGSSFFTLNKHKQDFSQVTCSFRIPHAALAGLLNG